MLFPGHVAKPSRSLATLLRSVGFSYSPPRQTAKLSFGFFNP